MFVPHSIPLHLVSASASCRPPTYGTGSWHGTLDSILYHSHSPVQLLCKERRVLSHNPAIAQNMQIGTLISIKQAVHNY